MFPSVSVAPGKGTQAAGGSEESQGPPGNSTFCLVGESLRHPLSLAESLGLRGEDPFLTSRVGGIESLVNLHPLLKVGALGWDPGSGVVVGPQP